MKCNQCGSEYESKRSTSKYCSAKCRKLAFSGTVRNAKSENGKVSVPQLQSYISENGGEASFKVTNGVVKDLHISESIPKIQNTPEFSIPNFGEPDCECKHCQANRVSGNKLVLEHDWKSAEQLFELGKKTGKPVINRVPLPGDVDYVGVAC